MAQKEWQVEKIRYCDHAHQEVGLEAEVVYPAEHLGEQAPRVLAHRCSHGMICNAFNEGSCTWAGTNPAYDPFAEPEEPKK